MYIKIPKRNARVLLLMKGTLKGDGHKQKQAGARSIIPYDINNYFFQCP